MTDDIRSHASGIATSLEQQASVHAEQSAAVSEITSTMEEFSASSSEIADYSGTVVDMATKAWDSTKAGAEAVEMLASHMMEINTDNDDNLKAIVELGRKSKEISKVMELIMNIADQTKLIAFNAALEAAGAGDAGKRFGVVAIEIRRLADNVMESTGETESKISEIQDTINGLVIASEKGAKLIKKGLEYTGKAAEVLEGIVDTARQSMDAAKQISLSTQQQKTASKQVVSALRDIATGSDQTLVSINDLGRVGKDLTRLADDLRPLVGKFQIRAR